MTLRRAAPFAVAGVAVLVVAVFLLGRGGGGGTAVGVVVEVESAGLTDVRGFTLRAADGAQTRYRIDRLENGDTFPPGHLVEHQATSEPVLVVWRHDGADRVAVRIEDAPAAEAS